MTTGSQPGPSPGPTWPTPPRPDLAGTPWPAPADRAPERIGVRGTLTVIGACVGLGAALAVTWWLLAPAAREATAPVETAVASDGALVVLSLIVGLAHGVAVVVRGGELAVTRVVVTFLAACAGAAVATGTGVLLGATERLAIFGAALLWPVAFLVIVGFAEALRYAVSREH